MDRNYIIKITGSPPRRSLSARRAWIEMLKIGLMLVVSLSLSARRAWIEIRQQPAGQKQRTSLSARRAWIEMQGRWQPDGQFPRRSPQGERG